MDERKICMLVVIISIKQLLIEYFTIDEKTEEELMTEKKRMK